MSVTIKVSGDLKDLKRELNRQGRVQIPRIATQALNRTATQVQSAAVKEVARAVGLPQKTVRQATGIAKANFRLLRAIVFARGRAFNLVRFAARQTKRGVTAKAWGKRKLYRGTFFGNKGRTVFVRKGKARLPIRPVYGPSIPRTMAQPAIDKALRQVVAVRFPINLRQAARRFLGDQVP